MLGMDGQLIGRAFLGLRSRLKHIHGTVGANLFQEAYPGSNQQSPSIRLTRSHWRSWRLLEVVRIAISCVGGSGARFYQPSSGESSSGTYEAKHIR